MPRLALLLAALALPILPTCRSAEPLDLRIDPRAGFAHQGGTRILLMGERGTLEIHTRTPLVPFDRQAGLRRVRLRPDEVRFYLGDHRGRLLPSAGPLNPLPPPRSVPVEVPGLELEALAGGGALMPDGWIEVGFPAFQADGLAFGAVAPVRLPIRGPHP